MDKTTAIEISGLQKIYGLKDKDKKHIVTSKFFALKDISLRIEKGEVVGILGTNGSGKTTLSRILAGITGWDGGELFLQGEVGMAAHRTGLNKNLTGLENIDLKCALMGIRKKQIEKIRQDVIQFADLDDFIYQPVKTYSSGMQARLGFSISLAMDPDILIVDEGLSTGDKAFAQKCMKRMMALRNDAAKTIIFVSHDLRQVREFCTRAIWIENGVLKEDGQVEEVCDHYAAYTREIAAMKDTERTRWLRESKQSRILNAAQMQQYASKAEYQRFCRLQKCLSARAQAVN